MGHSHCYFARKSPLIRSSVRAWRDSAGRLFELRKWLEDILHRRHIALLCLYFAFFSSSFLILQDGFKSSLERDLWAIAKQNTQWPLLSFTGSINKELCWVGVFFWVLPKYYYTLWSVNMISKFQFLWILLRYLKELVITVGSNWSYPYSSSSSWKLPSIIERERVQVISNQPKAWLADSDHKSHDHRPILRFQAKGF